MALGLLPSGLISAMPGAHTITPTTLYHTALVATGSAVEEAEELISRGIRTPEQIPIKRRFRPITSMFIGRRGQGKTAAMTLIAKMQRYRYMIHKAGWRIVANYHVSFADYCSPYLVEEIMDDQTKFSRCFILLDEISSSFPSRRSMARANIDFGRLLEQIRKLPAEMLFTTQFPQVLDYQLLLQVDYFIRCELLYAKNKVRLNIYDYWGQDTGKDYRKPWPPRPGEHDKEMDIGWISGVFDDYKSSEQIGTLWAGSRKNIIGAEWGDEVPVGIETLDAGDARVEIVHTPETLQDFVDHDHGGGTPFDVDVALLKAKRITSGAISNRPAFMRWLGAHGYKLDVGDANEGTVVARKLQPGEEGFKEAEPEDGGEE